jgi:hypothetical protein
VIQAHRSTPYHENGKTQAEPFELPPYVIISKDSVVFTPTLDGVESVATLFSGSAVVHASGAHTFVSYTSIVLVRILSVSVQFLLRSF